MRNIEEDEKCWDCKYRGSVPGSAHVCCNHPSLREINKDPLLKLSSILAGVGRMPSISIEPKELNIKASEHGKRMGWFNFPMNFDPVWLENCDGFKKRDKR